MGSYIHFFVLKGSKSSKVDILLHFSFFHPPGARFSKVRIIYMQDRGFNTFASNMIKLSVNETKWSSLPARTRALILYISI